MVGSPAQLAEVITRLRSIDGRLAAVRAAPGAGGAEPWRARKSRAPVRPGPPEDEDPGRGGRSPGG